MVQHLGKKNSLLNTFIAQIRDEEIQKDTMRFRRNLERIGECFAYEISKTFTYEERETATPMGTATSHLPTNRIVLATILRAGLPMHQGMLNMMDDAENAFVSAYRKHHKDGSFDIRMEYISCPDLDGATLIIADPMLATGASMALSIKELMQHGTPEHIHIVTAIASREGLEYVERIFPQAQVWLGDIDEELTAKSYIVPGLGDAGDLSYGAKVQE